MDILRRARRVGSGKTVRFLRINGRRKSHSDIKAPCQLVLTCAWFLLVCVAVKATDYDFSSATFTVGEGDTNTTVSVVTVTRSGTGVASAGGVDVRLQGVTATPASDFSSGLVTVSFAAGETNKTAPIELLGDAVVELDEMINLSFTNFIDGAAGSSQPTATLVITNDDAAVFTVGSASEWESDPSPLVFTAYLSRPVDTTTSVDVSTADGTALVTDDDYLPLSGQTLFFAAGVTSQTFSVSQVPDITVEASETFSVLLSGVDDGGRDVTASSVAGVGTILNDDGAALSIADVTVTENTGGTTTAVFVVRLDGTVPGGFAVQWAVSDGSARAVDGDYDPPQTAAIVFGGFDLARGGDYSLASGGEMASARASLLTAFPGATMTETNELTAAYLDTIDILVISSVKDAGNNGAAIDQLTSAEQIALRLFVEGGGGAIILVDNDEFGGAIVSDSANESLLNPFLLDVIGNLVGRAFGTVTNTTHPVANGSFGTVVEFRGQRMGYFNGLGPYAVSLGTWEQNDEPAVAVIDPSAISASSGGVVLMADSDIVGDQLAQDDNEILLQNAVEYVIPVRALTFTGYYGETQTIEITVNDDDDPETLEFFSVFLLDATPTGVVTIVDDEGRGYIIDDDAVLMDFGDLPASYGVTHLQDDGARHYATGPYLGTAIDEEINGQEGLYADIDDFVGIDDEDGITPVGMWSGGANGGRIQVVVSGGIGFLSGWIDWNNDGDFNDAGEHILNMRPVNPGTQTVVFPVPAGVISLGAPHVDYARFRIAGAALPELAVTGLADDGEVEDYYLIYYGNPNPIHYAWTNSPSPTYPYTSWDTAAHVLQDAIDAADPYDLVLATNGVYSVGGRAVHGTMHNRIVVREAVTVRSVNGPANTIITGQPGPGGSNGVGAARCAYLNWGSVLEGFTLTGGYTLASGSTFEEQSGGGAWCVGDSTLSNCVITANRANYYGAGVYVGDLYDCVVTGNEAGDDGGGAWYGSASGCVFSDNVSGDDGGGTFGVTASDCLYIGNTAAQEGGGAENSTLLNCSVVSNSAYNGGGTSGGVITRCTIAGNTAAMAGGGAYAGNLVRCTVTNNTAHHGGGVANVQATDSMISFNEATDHGGGANLSIIYDSLIADNVSSNYAGGAYEGTSVRCLIKGNTTRLGGGGTYYGVSYDSEISLNTARVGAGAQYTTLYRCTVVSNIATTVAGGVQQAVLHQCKVLGNYADTAGGIHECKAYNCLITGNSSASNAGGAAAGLLLNCTVSGNSAGGSGGGTYGSHLINSIVYFNSPDNAYTSTCAFTCTTPLPDGVGNIGGAPLFVNPATGNYRLGGLSPCVDAGTNLVSDGSVGGEGGSYTALLVDLDGENRPMDGDGDGTATHDMGAYELNPTNLPAGLNAKLDVDGDGVNGWEEFVAGTDASDTNSYLHITDSGWNSGFDVLFESRPNRLYTLEWSTELMGAAWKAVPNQRFIPGSGETLILTDFDTVATSRFYRVRVNLP